MVNRDPSESVVEVTDLSRQFGSTMALDGIACGCNLVWSTAWSAQTGRVRRH